MTGLLRIHSGGLCPGPCARPDCQQLSVSIARRPLAVGFCPGVSGPRKCQVYSIKELTSEPRTQTKILLFWLWSKGEWSLQLAMACWGLLRFAGVTRGLLGLRVVCWGRNVKVSLFSFSTIYLINSFSTMHHV